MVAMGCDCDGPGHCIPVPRGWYASCHSALQILYAGCHVSLSLCQHLGRSQRLWGSLMQLSKGEVGLTTVLVAGQECGQAGHIPLSTAQTKLGNVWEEEFGGA